MNAMNPTSLHIMNLGPMASTREVARKVRAAKQEGSTWFILDVENALDVSHRIDLIEAACKELDGLLMALISDDENVAQRFPQFPQAKDLAGALAFTEKDFSKIPSGEELRLSRAKGVQKAYAEGLKRTL